MATKNTQVETVETTSAAPAAKLTLALALAQLTNFINTHAETPVNETIEFDGGSLVLSAFSDHASFAASLYAVTEASGELRKAVASRSLAAAHKISQYRYGILTFASGEKFEKIGLSAIQEKDGARIHTPVDLTFVKSFFCNTNPEYLVAFLSNSHINMNYASLPHIPTLSELADKYPKLAELQPEGVKITIKAKNLAHVTFESADSLDSFFVKASHLQASDTVRLASQNLYVREAGTSDEFGTMNRPMFAKFSKGDLTGWEVYAVLNLV